MQSSGVSVAKKCNTFVGKLPTKIITKILNVILDTKGIKVEKVEKEMIAGLQNASLNPNANLEPRSHSAFEIRATPLGGIGQRKKQDGGKQNGGSPCNLKTTSFAEIVRVVHR